MAARAMRICFIGDSFVSGAYDEDCAGWAGRISAAARRRGHDVSSYNLGIRGDLYNGLTIARQAEPRLGVSYTVKPTNTVLRVSYARTLESPFNENLVLSSQGCLN